MKFVMAIVASICVATTAYAVAYVPSAIGWHWPIMDAVMVGAAAYIWGMEDA